MKITLLHSRMCREREDGEEGRIGRLGLLEQKIPFVNNIGKQMSRQSLERGGRIKQIIPMSEIDITTLPISKLRTELKKLGLSGSGTKKEMIERYTTFKAQHADNTADAAIPNTPVEASAVETPQEATSAAPSSFFSLLK